MHEILVLVLLVAVALYAAWLSWRLLRDDDVPTDLPVLLAALDDDTQDTQDTTEPGRLAGFLIRLGLPLQPWSFVLGLMLMFGLVLMLILEFIPAGLGLASAASAGLVLLLLMLLSDAVARRARRFEDRLIDSMDLMIAALKGGLTARQALKAAAHSARGRPRQELLEISRRLELGLPIEQALERLRLRYRSEGVRLFSQALIAKWHSGGDFAALLTAVTDLLRERVKLRLQVESQLSGARYAGLFAGLLPYLLIPLFLWRQPEWLDLLFQHPRGPGMLLGAVFLQATGFLWLRRVLRISL